MSDERLGTFRAFARDGESTDTPRRTGTSLLGLTSRRTWPLVPPAPILVIVLGVALAAILGAIGVRQLYREGEASAAARADLLSSALSARLALIPAEVHHDLIERASRRGSISVWIIDGSFNVVDEASASSLPIPLPQGLTDGQNGAVATAHGSVRFAMRSFVHAWVPAQGPASAGFTRRVPKIPVTGVTRLSVVVSVDVPDPPEGQRQLVIALMTLTALFIGIAAAVAYAVARDVRLDVDDLSIRIREIAQRGRDSTDRAQDMVPVQGLDEVGELASVFNALVERFALAEKTYADALARVEEIDRERSTFLATVSHELRSPLNAILGFADVLLSEVDGPLVAEAREEVAIIKQSGLHLLALINDILELSAIASAQVQLSRAPVDLVPLSEEVMREAMGVRGDKPLSLRVVSSSPTCITHVDARRVRQILTNLVSNAIKFTPSGEVLVLLEADSHYVTVRVRDTGPGIPKEERETIFDEFKQGGDRRSRRRGTGLGLAIARRLTLMHGGTLRLESEVGVGSTFVLKLPARPTRSQPLHTPVPLKADETLEPVERAP
ncbi:MAG: hypothetical protein NVS3B20_03020 [Polyangiales bacterium]